MLPPARGAAPNAALNAFQARSRSILVAGSVEIVDIRNVTNAVNCGDRAGSSDKGHMADHTRNTLF